MSEWKQKRFWKMAGAVETDDGFAIELDGRRVKTPAKAALVVPTGEMAQAIADEWAAQEDVVNPLTMPVTRSANAAIDKVRQQHSEVAQMLADYGDADLLCYRADKPAALVARQAEKWNPALDWAEQELGVRLVVHTGVLHQPQEAVVLARLLAQVQSHSEFQMAAFHDLVSLSGSLVLGFAATRNWRATDEIWTLSRLDDLWQQDQWGKDEDAAKTAELKRTAFLHAKRFFDMS